MNMSETMKNTLILIEDLETQKKINRECEKEYFRMTAQYNEIAKQNKNLQTKLNITKKVLKDIKEIAKSCFCKKTDCKNCGCLPEYYAKDGLCGLILKKNTGQRILRRVMSRRLKLEVTPK